MAPETRQNRRAVLRLLSAVVMFAAALAHADSALEDVLRTRRLRVAVQTDSAPYGFAGADLRPAGLDVDMAHYVARELGVELELVTVESSGRIPALLAHKADLVIATLGKSAEREKLIDFTLSYSPFFQAVFGPRNLSIKSFADLAGKTLGVTRGAMEDQELARLAPASLRIRRFNNNNATVAAYTTGQVQLVALGVTVAGSMMINSPLLSSEFKLLLRESPNYIGVPKGENGLRQRVNEILAQARTNGKLDLLSRKWLGRPVGNLPE